MPVRALRSSIGEASLMLQQILILHHLAGLPLVYNEAKIAAYWRNKPGELARRWANFARISGELLSFRKDASLACGQARFVYATVGQ